MIAEYSKCIKAEEARNRKEVDTISDEEVEFMEDSAWGLFQTVTQVRPYSTSDFKKVYFIRDPYKSS